LVGFKKITEIFWSGVGHMGSTVKQCSITAGLNTYRIDLKTQRIGMWFMGNLLKGSFNLQWFL